MAAGDLDAPNIPLLINGFIDPSSLNGGPLDTFAKYTNPVLGDKIHQSFLGKAEDGTAVDVTASIDIDPDNEGPLGFLMQVANHFVWELDRGQVFYSFFLQRNGEPPPGEESKRIHFGIGESGLLSALQIKESHDLLLDPDAIVGNFTIATVPYGVMTKGDRVAIVWKGELADGSEGPRVTVPAKTLSDTDTDPTNDPGQVLTWSVTKGNLLALRGGRLTLRYEITYARSNIYADTQSAERTFLISSPGTSELPSASIKDLTGTVINPGQFPAGIRVVVMPYAGMRIGDEVLVYGTRLAPGNGVNKNTVQYLKIDKSHLDTGRIEVPIAHKWLVDNIGGAVSIRWQYARPDAAESGLPLELTITQPRVLPTPTVDHSVTSAGRDELNPLRAIDGAYITIPASADVSGAPVIARWQGFGDSGSHEEHTPSQLDPMKFKVPPGALPPNFGKTVQVTYEVAGQVCDPPLQLFIRSLASYPGIECEKVQVGDPATLKLSEVTDAGLVVRVAPWSFISTRDQVRLSLSASGISEREVLPVRDVLPEEVTGGVKTRLFKTHLAGIEIDASFTLTFSASFDEGDTVVKFHPPLRIKLLA